MATMKKTILSNEKGFALLAAIIASMILLAVAMLIINMSVGDIMSSSMTVGNKKALAAAESGISTVIQNFNPDPTLDKLLLAGSYTTDCVTNPTNPTYIWLSIPGGVDANTKYAICTPVMNSMPPVTSPGYSMDSDSKMGYVRYSVSVVGQNTSYGSMAKIDIGVGFGPVPIN